MIAIPLAMGFGAPRVARAEEAAIAAVTPSAEDGAPEPDAPDATPDDAPEDPDTDAPDGDAPEDPGADAPDDGTEEPDADAPSAGGEDAAQPEEPAQPQGPAVVTAQMTPDERQVVLTASGGDAASAESLSFDVWSEQGGREGLVRHGAVRLDDGSWTATVFIASPTPVERGVPYNCRIDRAVHRLANPNTGQHLYTTDVGEADSLSWEAGWDYEGVAWIEPEAGTGDPVWRLYNPWTGDHLYTTDENEYAELPKSGWQPEDVAFHSDPAKAQPVSRLYNPFEEIGAHHFTTDVAECRALISQGWRWERVSWYGAGANGDGSWSLPSGNQPHGDTGTYHVEAVATPAAQAPESAVGEASFSVTAPSATVSIADVNDAEGTFDVVVGDVQSASGVVRVEVPVWTADDQHDIVWHTADPQPDGTYRTTVRATDHGLAHDYTIGVYLTCGNGLHPNVAQTSQTLPLANYTFLTGGPNLYNLTIINPGGSVRVAVWSEVGGQDDLAWYEATPQDDRWTATIDTANLLDSGHVIAQVHVDGEPRRDLGFDVSPKEVLTRRQRAIIQAAHEVPTLGGGYCAGWVTQVLMRAGLPYNMDDDADDMYYRLPLTDLNEILPGMAIAVSTHGHTYAGSIWGHVGIYLGDGIVIDDYGYIRTTPLSDWVQYYTDRVPVHFGFLEY